VEVARTVHTGIAGVTLDRNLIPALELVADMVLRPHLDDDEFEPIRALALQNLRSLEDDPGSKVIYELRRRHFPDPWGRCALGTLESVTALSADEVRRFFLRTYRPNGAILGVAGAIDWPALRDAVGTLFAAWPAQPVPSIQEHAAGPSRDHILRETHQTQIALAYPSVTVTSPDYYRALAATAILGGYSSARLFTEVREKRGLCYAVSASHESLRDRAIVLCYAGTSPDRAQETLDVTLAEIRRLGTETIASEELETMRAGLKSALIMEQESSRSRAGSLASDWFYLGRVRALEEISAALDALTPESVAGYAAAQDLDAMTIVTLGPTALRMGVP
jgi:predicted Zn-dependent peptidase